MHWSSTRQYFQQVFSVSIVIFLPFLSLPAFSANSADHARQGAELLSQGRWDEAIAEFNAALRTDPRRTDTHANLGMAYYFKGDSASAIPAFQEALRLEQGRVDAQHGLGLALYDRGDFAGAATAFRVSSQQNPAASYNLGNALEQQGNRDDALAAYQAYLSAAPPSPEAAQLNDAISKHQFPTPAAGTAQEHFRRGQNLVENNNAPGAVSEFLAALRLKPNYVEAANSLGVAFRAAGNLEEAIAAYQMAIRLNTKLSAAYRNLAQAFEDKGDRSAAAQGYDRYLLLAPGAADAADIRARIAKLRGGQ